MAQLDLSLMRAQIAEVLEVAPETIGDDDNLMDLGLDSIRAMILAQKWHEMGVPVDFSELAEHVTLAEWWNVVQSRLARG